MPAAAHPASRARGATRLSRALAVPAALALLTACGASSGGSSGPAATGTAASSASAAASASPSGTGAAQPAVVAVTAGGALEVLNPGTGAVESQLVSSGVLGDEVAVSASDTVYFAVARGCSDEIESVPLAGGTPVQIAAGLLPAISPDGTRLAYASEPDLDGNNCIPSNPDLTPLFKLEIRTLATGAQVTYPMVPAGQGSGLPAPISHLSWAPDGQTLAVSVSAVQDNEGWNLDLVNTAVAKYYFTGAGVSYVSATGPPTPQLSYLREGVYLPDGDLFISRACCAGDPPRNTSRLMWEVSPAGTLIHQVAIGFATQDHDSLDASPDGNWLLYLGGGDLYVSRGGATPSKLASGLIAAAFV
jgi:WD40-like Beta Propeller Repeat